jgi:hypothetical protein
MGLQEESERFADIPATAPLAGYLPRNRPITATGCTAAGEVDHIGLLNA